MKEEDSQPVHESIKTQLGPIRITQEAYDKANYIARRICEIADDSLEIYLYPINKREKQVRGDIAIRDIYIAQFQEVNGVMCSVGVDGQFASNQDIIQNLESRIIGWAHSHGEMSSFHSGTDDANIKSVLIKFGYEAQVSFLKESILKLDETNPGKTRNFMLGNIEYYLSSEYFKFFTQEFLAQFPLSIVELKKENIQIVYSIVFNANNTSPFCALGYKIEDTFGKIDRYPLKIIEENNGILTDKAAIGQAQAYYKELEAIRI